MPAEPLQPARLANMPLIILRELDPALSDARFRQRVRGGMVVFARPMKPTIRERPKGIKPSVDSP
jgi:hypothetical protein